MAKARSEHDPASDPPGAVSDQNGEEAQSAHRSDGTHPEPRTSGRPPKKHDERDQTYGAAGEGRQSTGHPDNAG
jgi:hypothetical protein